MANSADPDQMPQNVASDLGLYCLQRPICPNTNCAFDSFQKVFFCLMLYIEEVNLQTFVMI